MQLPWMLRMYFLPDILPLRTHTSAVIFGIYKLSLVSFSPMQTCHPSSPFAEALECRGQWEDGFQSPWSHTAAVSHKASCRKCFPTQERLLYLFCDIQEAGEKKMGSKENGLGNKRSESFSGQNHICNRLS